MAYQNTASFVDMHIEYKESLKSIKQVKQTRKGTGHSADVADCEIAGSMERDLAASVKEMRHRALQEFKSISLDDINNPKYGLTDRQRQICNLRQTYDYKEVAEILCVDQSTVYATYEQALNKIIRAKQKEQQEPAYRSDLSQQQNEILALHEQGNKPKAIAMMLGISPGTVSVQLSRIKKILTKS